MFCEARLAMNYTRVKELQRECCPSFGSTEANAQSVARTKL